MTTPITQMSPLRCKCGANITGWKPPIRCACGKVYQAPARGLGDTVERLIKTVTLGKVKTCPACQKRIDGLNARVPYESTATDDSTPSEDPESGRS